MFGLLKRLTSGTGLPNRLSYEEARAVLEAHQGEAETELASHPDTKPEMLYYLAQQGSVQTRRAIAAHDATPAPANRLLADDTDEDVRMELARKIGRLLPDLMAHERAIVLQQTCETLERLAQDQAPRVRAVLAEEIRALPGIPKLVIEMLAQDAEEIVCGPILEYSPLLSDNDLVEIIATARALGALAAIARRKGVSEEVSEAIVATLDISAVAALLANHSALVREETMEKLIDAASDIKEWHGPLVMRTDLSLRAIRRIAGFVSAALLDALGKHANIDTPTQAYLRHCMRKRLEIDPDPHAPEDDHIARRAAEYHAQGLLNETYMESLMEAGEREMLLESLSLQAGVPRAVVEKIFASRSAKAVTSLIWRCGLPMRVAYKIQLLTLKLHGGEILPATAGVAFPLQEDEMLWHLSYFGIETNPRSPTRAV